MKDRRPTAPRLIGALFVVALLWAPATALGHGETATTDPEAGAKLKKAPGSVSVALTEPPAQGARFTVRDGCGDVVSDGEQIDGEVLSTGISGGRPGRWSAGYKVISTVDGHVTKDSWRFKVAGRKDCSPDEAKNGGDDMDPGENAGGGEPRAQGPDDDEGGSFPVVPVALGTAGLVALALVIRTRSAT